MVSKTFPFVMFEGGECRCAVRPRPHQYLPPSGEPREALRRKGQFWTPSWVAEAMVHYVVSGGATTLFDPAVGEGAFIHAARAVARALGRALPVHGTELDSAVLRSARERGLDETDLAGVALGDFLARVVGASGPPEPALPAIVANPPYLRHHRLSAEVKACLRAYGQRLIGTPLDGRAGYHVYFLLHALARLSPSGRLAFIMPADTAEGVFAATLWKWITRNFRLDAVVTFAPEATPFPGVDTNAVIFLIQRSPPSETFSWARCLTADPGALTAWVRSDFSADSGAIEVRRRQVTEGLSTGLSRTPQVGEGGGPVLDEYAQVLRGIATGDNEFFFLTSAQVRDHGIPGRFLVRALGRTRDLLGGADVVDRATLEALDAAGRPTYLFSPDGRPAGAFPQAVQVLLREGVRRGLPARPLIGMRRPWYKMETRVPPAFLFAYLGRRSARFVRNLAGVVPLTGFLCVQPREGVCVEALWGVLRDPRTVANLARVGKSYGGGALKVEPRALGRLPLPVAVLREAGLAAPGPTGSAAVGGLPPRV
ncbi:MAG: N-6 DNA methylase [Deltaproteobacteria bacterium]|nr:N-6 DNA methylase [Deltaproteobacteria bacterium]